MPVHVLVRQICDAEVLHLLILVNCTIQIKLSASVCHVCVYMKCACMQSVLAVLPFLCSFDTLSHAGCPWFSLSFASGVVYVSSFCDCVPVHLQQQSSQFHPQLFKNSSIMAMKMRTPDQRNKVPYVKTWGVRRWIHPFLFYVMFFSC
jgi:hypothetical protein